MIRPLWMGPLRDSVGEGGDGGGGALSAEQLAQVQKMVEESGKGLETRLTALVGDQFKQFGQVTQELQTSQAQLLETLTAPKDPSNTDTDSGLKDDTVEARTQRLRDQRDADERKRKDEETAARLAKIEEREKAQSVREALTEATAGLRFLSAEAEEVAKEHLRTQLAVQDDGTVLAGPDRVLPRDFGKTLADTHAFLLAPEDAPATGVTAGEGGSGGPVTLEAIRNGDADAVAGGWKLAQTLMGS